MTIMNSGELQSSLRNHIVSHLKLLVKRHYIGNYISGVAYPNYFYLILEGKPKLSVLGGSADRFVVHVDVFRHLEGKLYEVRVTKYIVGKFSTFDAMLSEEELLDSLRTYIFRGLLEAC